MIRQTVQERYFAVFVRCKRSVYELETHLRIALMVEIITEPEFQLVFQSLETTLKLLNGFINSIEKRGDLK